MNKTITTAVASVTLYLIGLSSCTTTSKEATSQDDASLIITAVDKYINRLYYDHTAQFGYLTPNDTIDGGKCYIFPVERRLLIYPTESSNLTTDSIYQLIHDKYAKSDKVSDIDRGLAVSIDVAHNPKLAQQSKQDSLTLDSVVRGLK